jgi:hypothetical protein
MGHGGNGQMNRLIKSLAGAVACAVLAVPHLVAAQSAAIPPQLITPDKLESPIGTLELKDGNPSMETHCRRCSHCPVVAHNHAARTVGHPSYQDHLLTLPTGYVWLKNFRMYQQFAIPGPVSPEDPQ